MEPSTIRLRRRWGLISIGATVVLNMDDGMEYWGYEYGYGRLDSLVRISSKDTFYSPDVSARLSLKSDKKSKRLGLEFGKIGICRMSPSPFSLSSSEIPMISGGKSRRRLFCLPNRLLQVSDNQT